MFKSPRNSQQGIEDLNHLAYTHLSRTLPRGHVNAVTTKSEKQVENSRDYDKEVEESSGEKKVEIKENPPTPPEKEFVEKVEKEAPYVSPP